MFRVYIYSFPPLGSSRNSTSYFMCNQVWNSSLGCIQCTSHCRLCSCNQHEFCRVSSEKWSNRAYNSRSSIPVSPHCKTSTLVYNHNDAAKRAVILAYSLRVNCFNLSNATNTWTNSLLTVVLPAKNSVRIINVISSWVRLCLLEDTLLHNLYKMVLYPSPF